MKNILFLSALDFKEKSIQVIKRTPVAYQQSGFDVFYIVGRDTSKKSSYFYEEIIDLDLHYIKRVLYPWNKMYEKINSKFFNAVFNKLRSHYVILKMVIEGFKLIKTNKINYIYGYEYHGVIAAHILKKIFYLKLRNTKLITRFQGTFYLTPILEQKDYLKVLLNYDHFIALYLKSDLCIMTNDGTKGNWLLDKINSNNRINLKFWVNGVDKINKIDTLELKRKKIRMVTISRLEGIKRIDWSIELLNKIVNEYKFHDIKLCVVGDGSQKSQLVTLVEKLGLSDYIEFVGAINNSEVWGYLNRNDYFISTFESSNVGNPLLEAIRANKFIFTLNNGETSKWIKHSINGFIYEDKKDSIGNMAKDLINLHFNNSKKRKVLSNVKKTEEELLWTWRERLDNEIAEVLKL